MSIGKAMCFSVELNFYPDTFPHAHPPTRLYYFFNQLSVSADKILHIEQHQVIV